MFLFFFFFLFVRVALCCVVLINFTCVLILDECVCVHCPEGIDRRECVCVLSSNLLYMSGVFWALIVLERTASVGGYTFGN